MAFNTKKGKQSLFTEINITPLTDIFLVLLIIMMVIAPTFQSVDNNIKVPEINSGLSVEQKNAVVSVTKDSQFFVNGEKVDPDDLTAKLEEIKAGLENKEVVVKADESARSKEIMKVMQAAQAAEYEKLIVAGEPLSKKEQKDLTKDAKQHKSQTSNTMSENNIQREYRGTVGEIPSEE